MNENTLCQKKPRIGEKAVSGLMALSAVLVVLLISGIIVYCFLKGSSVISWSFLTKAPSIRNGTIGIGGNILNTLYIIAVSLLFAIPLGVGSAVYLNEYAKPGRLVNTINFTIQTLAGIPSILFGMFGMEFFGGLLGLEYSILTGGLTLAVLVFPIITENSREALKTVPKTYRDGALGLGAAKWHTIHTILLPAAAPGILTGILLSIGRIVGESAALIFTAGSGYQLPRTAGMVLSKIMQSGGSMSVQLYLSMSNADFDTAYGLALVLIVVVLGINFLTRWLVHRLDKTRSS